MAPCGDLRDKIITDTVCCTLAGGGGGGGLEPATAVYPVSPFSDQFMQFMTRPTD